MLDYFCGSSGLLSHIKSLEVLGHDSSLSDHSLIRLEWEGSREASLGLLPDAERNKTTISAPQVSGWRFRGSYTEEGCEAATAALSDYEDVPRFLPTL